MKECRIKKFFRFVRFGGKLLKKNIGTLLVFEILYKFLLVAISRPLLMQVFKLTLKVRGLTYLSDEVMSTYLKGPAVWVMLFMICLALAFVTLLDLCCMTSSHASSGTEDTAAGAGRRADLLSFADIPAEKLADDAVSADHHTCNTCGSAEWLCSQIFSCRNLLMNIL